MSSSFVTQCPHCRTRFRVNHAQLGAANGAVRCGACMHVFDAARHLVADQPVVRIPPTPTAAPTSAPATGAPTEPGSPVTDPAPVKPAAASSRITGTPPGKMPSDTLWIHDDLDIDDIDLDEELARLEREEMQLSQDFLSLQQAPKPAEALLSREPVIGDRHDETWAEALLNENSSEAILPEPDDRDPGDLDPLSVPIDEDELDPVDDPLDEAEDPPLGSGADEDDDGLARNAGRRNTEPAARSAAPYGLVDEPVLLDWRPKARPRGRRWLWALLNLLALAALAGQYIYRNFDDLARQDQFRPWFAEVCPMLGCQLPSKVDISQIRSSNLMVRNHPEFAGALIVDAIIYNRAPFAQPFPLLEMRFADLQGKPIASRRFKPAEYLAGELAGKTEMPSQTPIRIALEILDPGRHAENYSLQFLSPE